MKDILSKHELTFITSYTANKYVINWLNRNRVPYMLSGVGSPLVNRNALAHLMGDPTVSTPPVQLEDVDYSKLDGFK